MKKLNVIELPDKRLYNKAHPVTDFERELEEFTEDLFKKMYEYKGIGLAATQVELEDSNGNFNQVLKRIIVLDVPKEDLRAQQDNHKEDCNEKMFQGYSAHGKMAIVNPKIVALSKSKYSDMEGCLSIPNVYEKVDRSKFVIVEATDIHGKTFKITAGYLLARCLQHEMDHLDGILFIDRLIPFQKDRVYNKIMKKIKKANKGK